MRMRKQRFRIGELANRLDVERFIVRFWEKQFEISTNRSHGRQRYYDERDLARFQRIKELLYQRGFTIAGAKKEIDSTSKKGTIPASQVRASIRDTSEEKQVASLKKDLLEQKKLFEEQVRHLKQQLHQLREML